MTDLDNTQIIATDESFIQNSSNIESEASLKVISGTDPNIYQIGKETIIGRSSPSDLVISAQSLSKQHVKITCNNGQYFITDLGSSNKTFLNKTQLQPNICYALHDGDEIKLGDIICSFQEQKPTLGNNNTLSDLTSQTYIPVVNTLVDEDSPWPSDDDIPLPVVTETNIDVIPSTQTISDSYDDQEPTQPMKVWNENTPNNTNRLSRTIIKNSDDDITKSNGLNESSPNKSSSFIPQTAISMLNDDNDDGSLVIGATTLPATVPLVIESTQKHSENQNESSETEKIIEEDSTMTKMEVKIQNTQAYVLEPTGEEAPSDKSIGETQLYELEIEHNQANDTDTKREEVTIDDNKNVEQIPITKTISKDENLPMETLAYDLQPTNEETTTTISKNENLPMETLTYDLQPTNEETTTTISKSENLPMETLAYDLQPSCEEPTTSATTTRSKDENIPTKTLAYDLQATNEQTNMETTESALRTDTQAYDLDEQVDKSPLRPPSEKFEVTPASELIEQVEDKSQIEINVNKEGSKDEQKNDDQIEHPLATVSTELEINSVDKQQENINRIEDETKPTTSTDVRQVSDKDKTNIDIESKLMKQEISTDLNTSSLTTTSIESEEKVNELIASGDEPSSTVDMTDKQQESITEEEEKAMEESSPVSDRVQRGVPRRAARRARGRRGAAARARIVSTRLHGARRNALVPPVNDNESNNTTLEETVTTETEESPEKTSTSHVEQESCLTQPITATPADETSSPSRTTSGSNIRVSARIKARASSGRNRQFPYTDDYVDLDDLEKHSKTPTTPTATPLATATSGRRSARGGRTSSTSQKRISLRQQPIDVSDSSVEKTKKPKVDVYEQMDTGGENEEPSLSAKKGGRKRKSTTPTTSTTTKRTRSMTPQTTPTTRRKQASTTDPTPPSQSVTPKRGRKPTKSTTPTEQLTEKQISTNDDRPVRIALSSHLNFDQNHFDTLRKLGFEIIDESCQVDALVVDRIRRTKKFFMCLARGAHILAPTWIENMIKENRYIPYDKFYLEDTNAEARYGFQLRESVRLAKRQPIFGNYRIFCTKDTSPPYDDLKDIIEAAGGKFIEKINMNKPGKDLICIVGQVHKNEYEDLYKKGVPIVSEEFALSGISKQKLDFEAFSLFQNVPATIKPTGSK